MQVSWLLNVAAAPGTDLLRLFLIRKGTQNTQPWTSGSLPRFLRSLKCFFLSPDLLVFFQLSVSPSHTTYSSCKRHGAPTPVSMLSCVSPGSPHCTRASHRMPDLHRVPVSACIQSRGMLHKILSRQLCVRRDVPCCPTIMLERLCA